MRNHKNTRLLLLLTAFTGLHALLRLLYSREAAAYEMTLPHCCHAAPSWFLRMVAVGGFFFYSPSGVAPAIISVSWGCLAALLCVAAGGWRRRVVCSRREAEGRGE